MAIEIQHLNVYIKENQILKDISLTLPEKQITCIIGPSGCGKSTLLRTINRLIDSTEHVRLEGKVLVDGKDIIGSGHEITELRRKIGLVSQRPCPLPMSIFDNVAYGCRISEQEFHARFPTQPETLHLALLQELYLQIQLRLLTLIPHLVFSSAILPLLTYLLYYRTC